MPAMLRCGRHPDRRGSCHLSPHGCCCRRRSEWSKHPLPDIFALPILCPAPGFAPGDPCVFMGRKITYAGVKATMQLGNAEGAALRRMAAMRPTFEFSFFAARAGSTKIAAVARSMTLRRGRDRRHSFMAQQRLGPKFTGRGTRTKPLARHWRTLRVLSTDPAVLGFGRPA